MNQIRETTASVSSKICFLSVYSTRESGWRRGRNLLYNEPDGVVVHPLSVKFLWLLQFEPQPEQTERRNDPKAQHDSPRRSQMVLGENQNQDHWNERSDNVSKVDLEIGEHDKPPISMPFFEFSRALSGCNTSSGILPSDPDAHEESIRGQRGE